MNVDRYIGYSNPEAVSKKPSAMNVYQYIAYSNTDAANALCNKHGYYQIQSYDELADCLQSIVARKGESAFKEVMELHPEKEVVVELFMKTRTSNSSNSNYGTKKRKRLLMYA
jgi:hypothetical protein